LPRGRQMVWLQWWSMETVAGIFRRRRGSHAAAYAQGWLRRPGRRREEGIYHGGTESEERRRLWSFGPVSQTRRSANDHNVVFWEGRRIRNSSFSPCADRSVSCARLVFECRATDRTSLWGFFSVPPCLRGCLNLFPLASLRLCLPCDLSSEATSAKEEAT